MALFSYEALDSQGQVVHGEIEATTSEEAIVKIRGKSYFPTNVKEKSARKQRTVAAGPRKRKKAIAFGRVKSKQLAAFTRQLSTLVDAGLPIVRSLKILEEQQKPGVLKNQLGDVAEDVEGGSSLSEALGKHPKTFDKLYVNMVRAGEAGGVLDSILERLAGFMEKSQRLKKQVISALIYPAAVITAAGGILAAIMILVVPKFEEMFKDMKMELPAMTKMLITFSKWIQDWWFMLPLVPIGFIVVLKVIGANKTGRYVLDKVKLKMPLFGIIISKSTISRFSRTLGTLITSGVPILEALSIVKEATGNAVFENAIGRVHDSIREGENIAGPLAQTKIVDAMVLNMVDVGEETGELDKMLIKVADTYDEDVDALVSGMMSLIEPLLIIVLGCAVGFIVIALFLPLISLMQQMGGGGT
ncbi:MAG: type II secretion system F family protein [Planctomycetes bacterium]|nr:type II secretion system F family protein [Planctomycetota bacterium]